jgi:phage tail-like protein
MSTGGFQECTGLDVEMDVREHLEGGANHSVVRLVGRAKYTPITLKRGMVQARPGTANTELWSWFDEIVTGEATRSGQRKVRRFDGLVELWDDDATDKHRGRPAATWVFRQALPQKISGPQLNAATGAIAIEELQLAHQYLRLVSGKGRL